MKFSDLKNSIAHRIVFAVLVFSILLTLITSAAQLYSDYRKYLDEIESDFREIQIGHIPSVAASLWVMDKEQLQIHMEGIFHLSHIEYVDVYANRGVIVSGGGRKSKHIIHREYPLYHIYQNKRMYLGSLRLDAGLDRIYRNLKVDMLWILLRQGSQFFLIAVFILLIFQRLVTRHLKKIANHVGMLESGTLDKPLVLEGRDNITEQDELDHVATAINAMSANLKKAFNDLKIELERRRQSEEALMESKIQLAEAQRLTNIGSWDWHLASDEVHRSDETCRILGLSQEAVAPSFEAFLESVYPEDRKEVEYAVRDALSRKKAFDVEHRIIRPDGAVLTVISQGKVECDGSGCPVKVIATLRDITERRKTEKFIENILQTVDEGFIVIDRDYRIVSANEAYSKHVNMSHEDIIGKRCYEVSHKVYTPCYEAGEGCPVRYAFETGEHCVSLHKHHDKEGRDLYVETKSYPIKDASGNIVSVIETIIDITDKVRLEEQLRHSQKMEAIGMLAGGIAHDFNNILTAIMGYGNLIDMKIQADNPLKSFVKQILESADRAAHLTRSLLAFSRKQTIDPIPADANEIIRGVERFLIRIMGEDIELKTILMERELVVMADIGQMEQVLMNLATNARDAMPKGGLFTIETGVVNMTAGFAKKHGYGEAGEYALISIADTGMGMDESTTERIFEPFFTTKEPGQGTGLGLSIVYGIIKQNKGYINVYSEVGKGTIFKIYLPLISTAREMAVTAELAAPLGGNETILIAEDDEALRKLSVAVLGEYGYTVIEAENGVDAVNKFMENKEDIGLLIFDVIMPKKNGREAYEEIRKMYGDVKTIFISGYTSDIVHKKGMLEPNLNFLSKPIQPETLLRKIREVLDGKS